VVNDADPEPIPERRMALSTGTRLGAYEIVAILGAGGMGEVYRARDTRLKRDVAVKVLPDAFAHDADRLARFQREAEALATLNHPNSAAIYGLEQVGGIHAIVMELVEGPTLAERLHVAASGFGSTGPSVRTEGRGLPVAEALAIGHQVAEAVQAAHEKGVIHRDLKPANIKLRPDGVVKVLDFGLAKMLDAGDESASPDAVTRSPTATAAATRAGVILGTAAYMSPEQAKGRPADKRSDVWAFGAVLYEMLAGKRAFEGEGLSDTLAAVLRGEPDWAALPADLSPVFRALLKGCLAKDRRQRIGDIAAALFVLDERTALAGFAPQDSRLARPEIDSAVAAARQEVRRATRWRSVWASVVASVLVGAAVGVGVWVATRPTRPRITRSSIGTAGRTVAALDFTDRGIAIAPDGSRVFYVGNNGTQLFVRALDALEPVALASGAIRGPFVSPDGRWVGFVESVDTLKKVAATGGPAISIATLDGASRGATWLPDDTIVVGTATTGTGLQRVPARPSGWRRVTNSRFHRGFCPTAAPSCSQRPTRLQ
jgi:serine/threonine-protein kinase